MNVTLQPELDFDGPGYDPRRDKARLNAQAQAVFNLMRDGQWRTLAEIHEITRAPEPSVSARLRDFRKARFGAHEVERQYICRGLYRYKLHVNPAAEL